MKNIWRHNAFLPPVSVTNRISLGEGQTPLIRSLSLSQALGVDELFFKLENISPTGSYKDRFASVLVSMMREAGQRLCLSTSSGNTGASLAAYCAAAGISCVIVVVDGAPREKILQMQLYGAKVIMVSGFGKDAVITSGVFGMLEKMAALDGLPLPVSAYRYCAAGMTGVQTITYEIMEEAAGNMDHIFSPAGGGGLTLSVLRGLTAYKEKYPVRTSPRVHCVQPEGNDTIAGALRNNLRHANTIKTSSTIISGLQVPNILDGNEVVQGCRLSGGCGYIVTDQEIFEWRKRLAQEEGIFCEPAGAVAVAGLAAAVRENKIAKTDRVTCLITGSGFKDTGSIRSSFMLPEIVDISFVSLGAFIESISNN